LRRRFLKRVDPGALRESRLAREVSRRVPQPLDSFEVAAVIESMGITDPVAAEDYGARDVFELADRIFATVLTSSSARLRIVHDPYDPRVPSRESETGAALETTGRGVLALAPLAMLILTLEGLRSAGWRTSSVLALSFGITAAMLFTCGPLLAIGRRTAIYLGFDYRAQARRFLALATAATIAGCCTTAAAAFGALTALGSFDEARRVLFAGAFAACGVLWVLAAGLTATGSSLSAVASLFTGLVAGGVLGVRLGATVGLAAGYGVALAALLVSWRRANQAGQGVRSALPRASLLLLEGAPYIAFGSAFALLLVEPHVLGWVGRFPGAERTALGRLELSFTLALPPVLLASGLYERAMRTFWTFARARRQHDDPTGFRHAVAAFRRRELRRYAIALAAVSAANVGVVEAVRHAGDLHAVSQLVFTCAILGFLLLGVGQFNCLFMLSLAQPRPAVESVLAAVLVLTAAGIPLVTIDFRLAAPAFVAGAAALAAVSSARCRRVAGNADYHYAAAF
jgi:hypothetical protein